MTRSRTAPALLALLLLTACGGSGDDDGATATDAPEAVTAEQGAGGQTVTVDSASDPNRFIPERVQIAAGGDVTLTFTNSGSSPHDLVVEDVDGARTEIISGGEEETVTFPVPAAGTYSFVCTVHPGMDGELVVS